MQRSAKPSQTDPAIYLQRGSGKSSLISAAFRVDMSVRIQSYCVLPSIQRIWASQTRRRQQECPSTSTSRFVPMITIISLSMSALDLNPTIPRGCELSRISY